MGKRGSSINRWKLLAVALALTCLATFGGCLGGGIDGLVIEEVRPRSMTVTVSGSGKLEAHEPLYVYPGASAPLASLSVRDGDYVEAGRVLAALDQEVLQEELMKLMALMSCKCRKYCA